MQCPVVGTPNNQSPLIDLWQVWGQVAQRARQIEYPGGGAFIVQRGLIADRFREQVSPAPPTDIQLQDRKSVV